MRRSIPPSIVAFALSTVVTLAQTPPGPAAPESAAAPAAPASQGETASKPDATEPQGFTYNPEGRRDPFVSLLRRGSESQKSVGSTGLASLGTAEVSLRGTLVSHGAYVGILQGVDKKAYIVRTGDKLADGTIRSITSDAIVVLQQVNDPLSLEKEREVRKSLRETEEAK